MTKEQEYKEALEAIAKMSSHQDDPEYDSQTSYGNYDDCFSDGMTQAYFNVANLARLALK